MTPSRLPRLELSEENCSLKNKDYIIFRNHFKSKKTMKNLKQKSSKYIRNIKSKTKRKRHHKKSFFNIFR